MSRPARPAARSRKTHPLAARQRFAARLIEARMRAYGGEATTNQNYLRLATKINEDTGRRIDSSTLCRYERGQRVPSPQQMALLSRAYRVPITEMFDWLESDQKNHELPGQPGRMMAAPQPPDADVESENTARLFAAYRDTLRVTRVTVSKLFDTLERDLSRLEARAARAARSRRRPGA